MIKIFDFIKMVLLIKFMSFGCIMVTLRSETLLYINTSYQRAFALFGLSASRPLGLSAFENDVSSWCGVADDFLLELFGL